MFRTLFVWLKDCRCMLVCVRWCTSARFFRLVMHLFVFPPVCSCVVFPFVYTVIHMSVSVCLSVYLCACPRVSRSPTADSSALSLAVFVRLGLPRLIAVWRSPRAVAPLSCRCRRRWRVLSRGLRCTRCSDACGCAPRRWWLRPALFHGCVPLAAGSTADSAAYYRLVSRVHPLGRQGRREEAAVERRLGGSSRGEEAGRKSYRGVRRML